MFAREACRHAGDGGHVRMRFERGAGRLPATAALLDEAPTSACTSSRQARSRTIERRAIPLIMPYVIAGLLGGLAGGLAGILATWPLAFFCMVIVPSSISNQTWAKVARVGPVVGVLVGALIGVAVRGLCAT